MIYRTITTVIAFLLTLCIYTQDSLSLEQLEPLSYRFSIESGQLAGEGARFLIDEMSDAQYTMLGEYHGSLRISQFTNAIIPLLDSMGYKTLVLEVGPISGQVLNGIEGDVTAELKRINQKYLIPEEGGYVNTPIPFFESIEDAAFLQTAKNNDWHILGIDQEYLFGYGMLLDLMYANMSPEAINTFALSHQAASDSLSAYYMQMLDGKADLFSKIKNSETLDRFFTAAASFPANQAIIQALRQSNEIYWLNSNRQWFENNSQRVHYMKSQLKAQLDRAAFDLSRDKLLIKMGGNHVARGFSPLSLFEVGNMLYELAAFHGNRSVNIGFSSRFYMEDGVLKDILDSKNNYVRRFRDLNQMGLPDQWTVIDLRPLVKGHFYRPVSYRFNEYIEDLVSRFDLLIIPPTEMDPTGNY